MQRIEPYIKRCRMEEEVKKKILLLSILLFAPARGSVSPFPFPNSFNQQKECSSLLQGF